MRYPEKNHQHNRNAQTPPPHCAHFSITVTLTPACTRSACLRFYHVTPPDADIDRRKKQASVEPWLKPPEGPEPCLTRAQQRQLKRSTPSVAPNEPPNEGRRPASPAARNPQTNRGSRSDSRTSSGQGSPAQRDRMAAVVVRAIDQQATDASFAHLG
jgi:hypothetical protein